MNIMIKKIQCPYCFETIRISIEPVKAIDEEKKKEFLSKRTVPLGRFKKERLRGNKYRDENKELKIELEKLKNL